MVRHSTVQIVWVSLIFALLASTAAAHDETRGDWIRGLFTGRSPRPTFASAREAWLAAQDFVARTPGTFLLVGNGGSMRPLYRPGTVLVLRDVAYDELQPGQTVVYRNARARAVAHLLITRARDGWRVRGLNNHTHDPEPVLADNLIGVVVAAFTPHQSQDLARRAGSNLALFLDERDR